MLCHISVDDRAFSWKLERSLTRQLCRTFSRANSLQDDSCKDTCIQMHRCTDTQRCTGEGRDLVLSSGRQPVRTAISPTRSGAIRYSSFSSLLIATISPTQHTCHSILHIKKEGKVFFVLPPDGHHLTCTMHLPSNYSQQKGQTSMPVGNHNKYSSFSFLLIATISPAHHNCHSAIHHKRRGGGGGGFMPAGKNNRRYDRQLTCTVLTTL